MKIASFALLLLLGVPSIVSAQLDSGGATASWLGGLPPKPKADINAEQEAALEKQLKETQEAFQEVRRHPRAADADIFLKAVRYALDFREWYDKTPGGGVKKAQDLLKEARSRIDSLKKNETPWMNGAGVKILGFYSNLDDSPQPYGVEVPEGLEWGKGKSAVPMWIWLHGRGDTMTDLYFIHSKLSGKGGEFKPKNAIVVHPFGRYCNGFKSAGEVDVLESGMDATVRFNVDTNRIALMGFSMGGAGAWHMGAHYADQWAAVHTGAGFVDVKRYQRLTPEKMPPAYEQTLWGVYDVPNYARNFFNVPLISYSGETDKQRDSAEYMSEVLAGEGFELKHLIGPGMGHKYHPETRDEITRLVEQALVKGRMSAPDKVWLQTRSARYVSMHWVTLTEVWQPWKDTRVEAVIDPTTDEATFTTKNVKSFMAKVPWRTAAERRVITLDGQKIKFLESRPYQPGQPHAHAYFATQNQDGQWTLTAEDERDAAPRKAGGTCIEDAFMSRFVIVLPDKPGRSAKTDAWVKAESEHFIQRWRRLMRGDPLVAKASEVGKEKATTENLILWGDDVSNSCIAERAAQLPVKWNGDKVSLGNQSYASENHVPVLVYPEVPFATGQRAIVLNSGLTFREAHDRTNSLQNPKLPDWAILDIDTPRDGERAGKVVATDFFDREWQVTKP